MNIVEITNEMIKLYKKDCRRLLVSEKKIHLKCCNIDKKKKRKQHRANYLTIRDGEFCFLSTGITSV